MRSPRPKTFFWQLVLSTVAVQTICLSMYIVYIVVTQERTAEERTRTRISRQLEQLAPACAQRLAAGDIGGLHEVLELSRVAPTINGARITDLAGKTLAVSTSNPDNGLDQYERVALERHPQSQEIFSVGNGPLEAVTPILQGGKPVALLWLEPNHALSQSTIAIVVRIALTYGVFALLVNIIPIFLVVRTMTKSLQNLLTATERVILQQDLKTGFPLPITSSNEAGALTVRFNTMVRDLESQRSGLLETLALLDSMLENAPIGFAFIDRDLRFVRLNRLFAAMYGMDIGRYLGHRVTNVWPQDPAARMEDHVRRVLLTGQASRNVEFSNVAGPDGEQRTWLMHFYPVRTESTKVASVGVVVGEITERLRAEETLRKTEKLAATGRLAASIAHEINNPLEAVTNLLYLLKTHEPMDEAALRFVDTAQDELARVAEITQQTLRFYRQSTHAAEVNVSELLDSVVTLYQTRLNSAAIKVLRKFDGNPEIFGFSGELRQVFANLIGNALDAMPTGGRLLLRVRNSFGRDAHGNWERGVRICIADTGTGMSAETLARVFEAFFTTKSVTGTGLGLWVSEQIIRKHAGSVRVKSLEGARSGTSFVLFFPKNGGSEGAVSSQTF